MPTISVVIPVHGVEAYLPRCLDSIQEQSGQGIEIIAVDDASPDRCGEILAERGVTTIRTPSPVGPGRARELGAEKATGEYVWFVDGDDELAPGALAAVAGALGRLRPDVLILDYENLYPDGTTSPSGADLSGPELTTLADRPALINLTMTVWSKVFRRGFPGVAFGPSIHEDVPVSASALLTATRIALLDRVCYRYRRQRQGSFLAATSDLNFAIFASYDRVLSEQAVVPPVRAAVFERAMWHYTTVFPLVPAGRRREFFRHMTADFHRWRPPEFTFPPGARGAKLRLVERGAYSTYVALEPLNRVRVALRRRLWCDWGRNNPRGDLNAPCVWCRARHCDGGGRVFRRFLGVHAGDHCTHLARRAPAVVADPQPAHHGRPRRPAGRRLGGRPADGGAVGVATRDRAARARPRQLDGPVRVQWTAGDQVHPAEGLLLRCRFRGAAAQRLAWRGRPGDDRAHVHSVPLADAAASRCPRHD